MTTYYISGPMRGKPRYNRDQFNATEAALTEYLIGRDTAYNRHKVINPSRNFGGDQSRETSEYMTVDLKQVLEADVIVLLPSWTESEGAKHEVQVALWTGKRFMQTTFTDHWTFEDIDISAPPVEGSSPRADMLDEANALITGDRNNAYGSPTQDFSRSANALNAYGYRGPDGRDLMPHDIAIFVMAVKISRLMWTPKKRDSWVDIAGYAGCGYECSVNEDL